MARPALALVTEQEFLGLPESMDKVELIDGEIIVSPSPRYLHQQVVVRLARFLQDWAERQPMLVTVGLSPLDVRFAAGRILQPDLFVLFARVPVEHEGPITQIPELCIEVLSDRANYDRLTKRVVYAEAGVKELWTVQPGHYVERWSGEHLSQLCKLEETLESELLPGFAIELAKLFE